MRRHGLPLPLLLGFAAACSSPSPRLEKPRGAPCPPSTPTVDVVDDYHGTAVADPYRWLEDLDDPRTREWVAAQNRCTEAWLSRGALREELRERLTELWNYRRKTPPRRHGDWWFWTENDGLRNQPVFFRGPRPLAAGEVLLDPNTLSPDGTVALAAMAFAHDGGKLAYAISRAGSDWREWRVLDVATGSTLPDRVLWSKFSGAAWTHDGAGFFYVRYPRPREGEELRAVNRGAMLCYHRLGTPQAADEVVYERPDRPEWSYSPAVTEDGRYLLVTIWRGTERKHRVGVLDLQDRSSEVRPLIPKFAAAWSFVINEGSKFYFRTDLEASRGRVVALDLAHPDRILEVVPERRATLASVHAVGDRLIAVYLADAHHSVEVFDLQGKPVGSVHLPRMGSVGAVTGRRTDDTAYLAFTSFTTPTSIHALDVESLELRTIHAPAVPFDPDAYITRQIFYQSKDGTRVPMFLVHRKGLRLNGDNPVYLYGYGGFAISLSPGFRPDRLVWLEAGGVYAQANLRGGGEYGETWHRAGMGAAKQNVFDDFLAAADYLIRNDYTAPARLAIGGASNGGLLVGACLTQEPGKFGAAVVRVGVLDMLRYHRFTIGWAWGAEYGTSDDPKAFEWLRAYSPLHNVRPGTHYPPTLIMTGDHDDRVFPAHSYKFAAALQAAQAGPAPVLLRVTARAGHGAGKPTAVRISEAADMWTFLHKALGVRR